MKREQKTAHILQYYAKYGFKKTITKFNITDTALTTFIRKDRFYKIEKFYIDYRILRSKQYAKLDRLELIELIKFKRRLWILARAILMENKDNVQ
jgi:hypothetical protein